MRFTDIVKINYKIVKSVILYKISITSYMKNEKMFVCTVFGARILKAPKSLGGIVQC